MQIYVRENKVWTVVNGINCAETEQLPTVRPGYIRPANA